MSIYIYNTPSKILDEYSELARNKAMKTRASRVNAIFEFYSTRLARYIFFQDKISVERVESSKMSTLIETHARVGYYFFYRHCAVRV